MKDATVHPVANLAKIRQALILARYYRQLDQADREISQYEDLVFGDTLRQSYSYDGINGRIAQCLRIGARNMLVALEKRAGTSYMLGFSATRAAQLSEKPFREWPEYQHIFSAGSDLWSVPF